MVSILIPTYNYACVNLVKELSDQMISNNIIGEIIVLDDCSNNQNTLTVNRLINDIECARFVELKQKYSISKMRNLLVEYSQYNILLCLDSDAFPVRKTFLTDYLKAIEDVDVVSGGLLYRKSENISSLRYRYGNKCEAESIEKRRLEPYNAFKTVNYCIKRHVFDRVCFDETINKYGHEDLFFGKELEQNGFKIKHIDNPVYHDDKDEDFEFLQKTYVGLNNLAIHQDKLQSHSRILQMYNKFKRLRIAFLFRWAYVVFGGLMERHVLSGRPSVRVFQLLKLCYLSYQMVHMNMRSS